MYVNRYDPNSGNITGKFTQATGYTTWPQRA